MPLSNELQKLINDSKAKQKYVDLVGEELADKIPCPDLSFTMWDYHCAFTLVANPENWKLPINALIDPKDKIITVRAISNATSSTPNCTIQGERLQITADGYYIGTGEG